MTEHTKSCPSTVAIKLALQKIQEAVVKDAENNSD